MNKIIKLPDKQANTLVGKKINNWLSCNSVTIKLMKKINQISSNLNK